MTKDDIKIEVPEDVLYDEDKKDTIDDEQVEHQLNEMAFIWGEVMNKIKEDNICFDCKKEFPKDAQGTPVMYLTRASKVPTGSIAMVGLCDECYNKNKKEV